MSTAIYELCFKWQEDSIDPYPVGGKRRRREGEPDIPVCLARVYVLVCFALYFPPLSLRQWLPRLGPFAFPSKLLRCFLRGCAVAAAHALVTAPAGVVFVTARKKTILGNRIFARVMSGCVMREEGRLQAAAAARIADKSFNMAALRGDLEVVLGYLIADAKCVNKCDQ
jgi:hypothetical protein